MLHANLNIITFIKKMPLNMGLKYPVIKLNFCSLHSLLSMEFSFLLTLPSVLCVRKFAPIQPRCRHLVMCSVILVSINTSTSMGAAQSHTYQVPLSSLLGSMLIMKTRKEQYNCHKVLKVTRVIMTYKVILL